MTPKHRTNGPSMSFAESHQTSETLGGKNLVDDGLPVTTVGAWTTEKHERLRKYVTITAAVRRKFANTETTYIELFSGPGRSIIEGTGETVNGSPVLAAQTAIEARSCFSDIHLSDVEASYLEALRHRIPEGAGRLHLVTGIAEETVNAIAQNLNPYGLHFAFLDPYKLDPLPFSIIERLAKLNRMDMLIHVSVHDLQRNLRRYMQEGNGPLDRFAPGWRAVIDERASDRHIRIAIFQHWLSLIRGLDMAPSSGVELVAGSQRQRLYWLVLAARHTRAGDFWEKIRNVSSQGRLNL